MSTSPIVFFGSPPFAVASLEAILKSGRKVSLVVTQPDKPAGRGRKLVSPAVKEFCLARHLPLLQPVKMKDPAFHQELRKTGSRCFVVAAYGRILPAAVLEIPELTLNVHASLLPRWRGAAPIEHAILAGDTVTGISIMRLAEELDAGDVLHQEETPVRPEETAGELSARLAAMGGDALVRALDLVDSGRAKFTAQDASRVTFAPPLEAEAGKIDWAKSSRDVHNHVRAMNPRPGAYAESRVGRIKIHRTRLVGKTVAGARPGTLRVEGRNLLVACGDQWLEAVEIQRQGKARQSASNFLAGYRLEPSETWQ